MKKLSISVIYFFVLFSLINCVETEENLLFDYELFLNQKKAWKQTQPNNYQYNFTWKNLGYGFKLGMGALIIVENGLYKDQIINEDEMMMEVSTEFQTIDKIYEHIESNYKRNLKENNKDFYLKNIEIEYDLENHIPLKTVFYYYVAPGATDIGNSESYLIENFKIH